MKCAPSRCSPTRQLELRRSGLFIFFQCAGWFSHQLLRDCKTRPFRSDYWCDSFWLSCYVKLQNGGGGDLVLFRAGCGTLGRILSEKSSRRSVSNPPNFSLDHVIVSLNCMMPLSVIQCPFSCTKIMAVRIPVLSELMSPRVASSCSRTFILLATALANWCKAPFAPIIKVAFLRLHLILPAYLPPLSTYSGTPHVQLLVSGCTLPNAIGFSISPYNSIFCLLSRMLSEEDLPWQIFWHAFTDKIFLFCGFEFNLSVDLNFR